jgi:hypothetical protein
MDIVQHFFPAFFELISTVVNSFTSGIASY